MATASLIMLSALSKFRERALLLRIEGKLCYRMADGISKALKCPPTFKPRAILVSVNCSRGSLVQADIIASSLRLTAEKYKVPLYTFAEDMAIGPGYWVLAAGHKVFVDEYSMVGGVSVAAQTLGLTGFAKQWKLETAVVASGKNRVRLNAFEKVKIEDEEWVKALVKEQDSVFQAYVKKQRPKAQQDLLNGDIFKGKRAVEGGLVDEIGDQANVLLRDFPGLKSLQRTPNFPFPGMRTLTELAAKARTEGVEETEVLEVLDEEWMRAITQRTLAQV